MGSGGRGLKGALNGGGKGGGNGRSTLARILFWGGKKEEAVGIFAGVRKVRRELRTVASLKSSTTMSEVPERESEIAR